MFPVHKNILEPLNPHSFCHFHFLKRHSWFLNNQIWRKQTFVPKPVFKASQGIVEELSRSIKRDCDSEKTLMDADRQWKRDQNNSVALQWRATEHVPRLLTAGRNQDWDKKRGKEHEGKRKDVCVRAEKERQRLFGRGGGYLRGAGLAK